MSERELWFGWCMVGLSPGTHWVSVSQSTRFREREILLLPASEELIPTVAMRYGIRDAFPPFPVKGKTAPESGLDTLVGAKKCLRSFLAALSYNSGLPMRVVSLEINSAPVSCVPPWNPRASLEQWDLAIPASLQGEGLAPALASFRSAAAAGWSLDAVYHYFRVLERITSKQGTDLAQWINEHVEQVRGLGAAVAGEFTGRNVGDYLVGIRNSSIHANRPPQLEEDDEAGMDDVYRVLPLLEGLSRVAIEAANNL